MNKYSDKRMNKKQQERTRLIAREYLIAVRNDPNELKTDDELFEDISLKLNIEVRFVKCIVLNRSKPELENKKQLTKKPFKVKVIEAKERLEGKYGRDCQKSSITNAIREVSREEHLYWNEAQIKNEYKRNWKDVK